MMRPLPVAAAATGLALVDFTAVVPTVPEMARALQASVAWTTWALSGMSLGLAAALLMAGTVADRVGRRRTLRAGLLTLAASTALSAGAPSIAVFVGARIAQGIAGAAVLVASLAAVADAHPSGRLRVRATAVWAASLGAGIAVGPVLSATLARASGWRAVYWYVAAGSALLALATRRMAGSHAPATRRFDVPGAATLSAGMACLTGGFTVGRQGWTSVAAVGLLVAAGVLLALFALVEARSASPMLEVRLMRRPGFVNSLVGAFVVGMTTIALMSYAPSYFERALGLSGLASALLLAVWSATSAVASWHVPRLPARLSVRHQLLIGLAMCTVGLGWLATSTVDGGWTALLPAMALTGVGTGVTNAALGQLAVASVPPEQAGLGSGANNTARYLGGAAGVAVVLALAVPEVSSPTRTQLAHGWDVAAAGTAIICALGALAIAAVRDRVPERELVAA